MEQVRYKPYTRNNIHTFSGWARIPHDIRQATNVVSLVLPFRTNEYVLSELIDWDNVPEDPIFRLTFHHRDMLEAFEYRRLEALLGDSSATTEIGALVDAIRQRMNPHPAGQMTSNIPSLDGVPLSGLQHKNSETVLFFPSAGQTCHAFCTFCFRWPQFVGDEALRFGAYDSSDLVAYLKRHREVTDVLITGGDPLIMSARALARYIEPLLDPELQHIQNIRIGTKSVSYWPHRFVSDEDSDDLLRLFEGVVLAGKNLAVMGHYNHPVELQTPIAQTAVKRILSTGATLRMQSPLVRHINDDPRAWSELWKLGVRLGAIPYYMFVERDTGPRSYFELPLANVYEIFREAYASVSGLARTVRGPSMSTFPGKVLIDGIVTLGGEKLFALQFLQARDPAWTRRPFYARFDPAATWFDQLVPAFGEPHFFFEADRNFSMTSFRVPHLPAESA